MEENQTQVTTEETAPQVETEETATEVITETEEQPTTVEPNSNDDAEQQTSEEDEQTEQIGESNTDLAPFLSVRFNHETRELTQTEAQSYAQKGLQAEPIFAKLRYLAAQEGKKSVKEFVEALETTAESARLENIKSQLVDDGNAELLESIVAAEQQKFREAAGVIEEDEKKAFASEYESEHSRLADEFIALQKEFPEFGEFKDLPQSVLRIAQKEKISLLDAHLRHQHAENKKIKKAEMSAAAAAESSTGSMQSSADDATSSILDAMRKGIWS